MVEVVFENFVNYLRSGNTDKLNIISFQQNQQHKINLSTQLIFYRILTKTVVQLTFFVLTVAALFRCVMFLLLIFKKNMDGNLVQISMFFVPEFVPGVLMVGTQISVYKREREYYLEYALETVELLSETVQQYN
ncbi:Hypothetical_protein [Hexamita inflata]|uniref:Hypothetical_protein n=1 Tax=Hexamita inflata TaxID=28002 RepID=A0AA86R180_9EUKA|nr:Hypothetical protein HINF_LOCUS51339 [Hexamita inflata]